MDNSKISRNQTCNIHTDQKVISVCLEPSCFRPVLCLDCIKDTDIHPLQHNKIISLQNFIAKVEKEVKNNKNPLKNKQTVTEIRETASRYQISLQTVKANVELEKKMIDEAINELITAFAVRMQQVKHEVYQKLDGQVNVFSRNFKNFAKLVHRLPPDDDKDNKESSMFENLNKCVTYNQIDELVRQYQQELSNSNKNNANKAQDEHLLKLKTVSQALKDNTNYPCSLVLTNSKVETVRQKLTEDITKFLTPYLKFQKEFAPMDLNTLQCDSKILKDEKSLGLIKTFLKDDYKDPALDLLYRGSRDGFTAGAFHAKCDKKGPTLTVINSTKDKTFGAYTDADWVTDEQYKSSKKSFLFSIDHKEKYKLKVGHDQYAVKGSKSLGPCFGGGHDLRLSANFIHEECSGYVGFSYDAKDKYSKDIYGDNSFYVKEIEVYRVLEDKEIEEDSEDVLIQKKKSDEEEWEKVLDNLEDRKEEEPAPDRKGGVSSIAAIEDMEVVVDWISPQRNFTLELLYRATRDGFGSEAFHKKCDNKGATLTLIKSKKYEQVFGGFTKQSWKKGNEGVMDKETFIFSLTKKEKFPVSEEGNAIFRSNVAGPVFGEGDIFICSDCDKKKESYSNLGVGFEAQNMEDSSLFLADEQYFLVDNIEVFKVNFIN